MKIIRSFVTFEGGDGSGTTTQLSLLEKRFQDRQPAAPVLYPTFEPTNGPVGTLIRSALNREITLHPDTLARLFAADRTEHLYGPDGVVERCGRGELVISDRYVFSSLVYQGIECGDELPRILNAPFPAPELYIYFDIDPLIALERIRKRPAHEIYEYVEFQHKVREKYRSLLDAYQKAGGRAEIIDASQSPEAAAEEVWRLIREMPILTGR